jgi:hypothetical protein
VAELIDLLLHRAKMHPWLPLNEFSAGTGMNRCALKSYESFDNLLGQHHQKASQSASAGLANITTLCDSVGEECLQGIALKIKISLTKPCTSASQLHKLAIEHSTGTTVIAMSAQELKVNGWLAKISTQQRLTPLKLTKVCAKT